MKIAMFRWLAPAFLVAVCSASLAQTAAGKRADPLDSSAAVPPLVFQSTLGGYQRHAEQPVGSWREANETVNRVGGWRPMRARLGSLTHLPRTTRLRSRQRRRRPAHPPGTAGTR